MNKERRKALQTIVDQLATLQMQLEEIQTEEEEYRDNIPENFQSGERYEHHHACNKISWYKFCDLLQVKLVFYIYELNKCNRKLCYH